MRVSEDGLLLIQAYEGLGDGDPSTVLLEPYLCPAKVWTVGWGHALTTPTGQVIDADIFGPSKARQLAVQAMDRLFRKQAITRADADRLLRDHIGAYEQAVSRLGPMDQAEFDAMVSLCFNIGAANFRSSSVARNHAAGNRKVGDISMSALCRASKAKAAPTTQPVAFTRWANANNRWMLGLFRRRLAEVMVYGGHPLDAALRTSRSFRD